MSQGRRFHFARALALAGLAFASGCGQGGLYQGPYSLALKYVVYRSSSGVPVADLVEAQGNVDAINSVWKPCEIQFTLEDFEAADPLTLNLNFSPRDFSDLSQARKIFASSTQLLIVTTGPWDRSGNLGSTTASGYTMSPAPTGPFGAVIEQAEADYFELLAHELGHYVGLAHVKDVSDVMNPVVYPDSQKLSPGQCAQARQTVADYWQPALR
jgi:hypothetical protein